MGHLRAKIKDFIESGGLYCVHCQQTTSFARPPSIHLTRVGLRPRLKGKCAQCGHRVSSFLPTDDGPARGGVKVSTEVKQEIVRAASLLGISQKAFLEKFVDEALPGFVQYQLDEMRSAGIISRDEEARRVQVLELPVEEWQPDEAEKERRDIVAFFRWMTGPFR